MKKLYTVVVEEIRKCEIEVEAESEEQALELADKEYWDNVSMYDSCLEPYDTHMHMRGKSMDITIG